MLVALTIGVLVVEQRFRGREQLHRLHGSGARRAAPTDLGRWRWAATAACSLLVLLALVVPLLVIGWWWWRGVSTGLPWWPDGSLVVNSLRAAALGAIATVLAAWPVAWLGARQRGPYARFIERLAWSGYALPGLVVALALVFFGIRVVPSAYQTLAMLVFAYAVLFLPQAIGALRSSLLQITPSVEEASRLLGVGSFGTFRRVIVPLARPGALAGGALVFLTCMKELPATLLLAPTGYTTLATRVWNATAEGFLARAAGPALALVLLSSLPMAYLVLREHEPRSAETSADGEGDGRQVDRVDADPVTAHET
jgi:iron(III) transport system permease protein